MKNGPSSVSVLGTSLVKKVSRLASVLSLGAVVGAGGWSAAAAAQDVEAQVPTYVDSVERGLRLRADLWGRYNTIGLPDPPVRLEVDEVVNDNDDLDVNGLVLFGWDRPFGVPVAADFMGDIRSDIGGDSPVSPFLDDTSVVPRAHLYSAYVGFSGAPGELLEPLRFNIGRMTEIADAPITFDGVSTGVALRFPKLGYLNAKIWGGLDAPQNMATDPFTRVDAKAYAEKYEDDSGFVSPTGGLEIERTRIADPILNAVGGLAVDGRFSGVGFVLSHTLLPTVQRSKLGASYAWDADLLSFFVGADLKASDFVPNNVALRGDLLTGDGTTRVGFNTSLQFLEDVCAYDCTFRAFNAAAQLDGTLNVDGKTITNNDIETFRVRDQIRHLNIGPAKPHFAVMADVERQLPFNLTASARGRFRQHFNDADLDYFRTNVLEGGLGVAWSSGVAMDVGTEILAGTMASGVVVDNDGDGFHDNDGTAYDLLTEGVQNYLENRIWVRTVLLEGKLSNLAEVFVRRMDIQTKALAANGQWGSSLASTIRYDVLDFWSVSARFEADALSPVDSLNGSGYLGGLIGTSLRF
jgi:hypothetical protein